MEEARRELLGDLSRRSSNEDDSEDAGARRAAAMLGESTKSVHENAERVESFIAALEADRTALKGASDVHGQTRAELDQTKALIRRIKEKEDNERRILRFVFGILIAVVIYIVWMRVAYTFGVKQLFWGSFRGFFWVFGRMLGEKGEISSDEL